MPKLFVIGDSFSYPYDTTLKLWPELLAENLSKSIEKPVTLINISMIGVSQDWVVKNFTNCLSTITSEDFLVIIWTSNERFWFFEDHPEHSNIVTLENVLDMTSDPNLINGIVAFFTKIWRGPLANQLEEHRLGYLSYKINQHKLRAPLILKGFEYIRDFKDEFPDLLFSKHSLYKVQTEEFALYDETVDIQDKLLTEKYWDFIDCRNNHLSIRNHSILAEILCDSLLTNSSPDLSSQKFHKKFIDSNNYNDKNFASKEFNSYLFNTMLNKKTRKNLGAKTFQFLMPKSKKI